MPYTYSKVDELEGSALVGSHQCVALVQEYAGAPVTSVWRQGDAVLGNTLLKKGTAIATFLDGRYANNSHGNHAALYLRQGINGIYVMDQWKNEKKTEVNARFIRAQGKDKKGRFIRPSDNANAFFVIE
ncbi:BPSL0067 family protein [Pseudoduganella aquatica]|uniref:BPSL0067 family protein n=1 Tax=Pseudoduganella aquatica TaxID=2660641 RepID=A0A7X4KL44_9BURK|nr:BPSL0067 family protein [Pseudoduganella aquatica]MYN07794.1 BPSL0067 family protein [Pseudoduganella aquatica]